MESLSILVSLSFSLSPKSQLIHKSPTAPSPQLTTSGSKLANRIDIRQKEIWDFFEESQETPLEK
ncbi:hypothetical protein RchiOBHm_Chr7g0223881 [Rosa chinensis]|uniref:Uncharacterized protein n=1 Tax=Rosa chinensis TaxID=74649 RepID=A0A2P6PDP3_ROSCH|nr:hypothetical protein RchiOBHm_Chr7g0223881 [Rosa chinensis]